MTARPVPLQPPSPLLLAAMDAHGRGQWGEAEARYRKVLAADPRDAVAWHGYAVLEHQRGDLSGGLERIRRAIELQPAVPEFQVALGNLLKADGRLQEAAHAYFLAVSMNPRYVEAYNNLGTTYRAMGTLPEAEAVLQQALRIRPGDADVLCNLGAVCLDLGRPPEAVAHLREATRSAPTAMEGWFNLGNALHAAGSDEEAAGAYQHALKLAPDLVPGWYNLGNLLCRLDRLEDAGTCYQRVLALDPGHVRAIFNLGNVLQAGALHDDAIACYREVLRHRPDHALAHFWWATALANSGRSTEASEHYDLALALDPAMARAYHMKGGMLYNQGRIGEAIRVSLKALDVQRELPFTFSNSLFMMNYADDVSAAELSAKHREFQERFGAAAPRRTAHANVPEPGRRIRIGYLSPDLRRHSVSYFIEPVLAHHDRDRFEVHCYFNSSLPDEVTARFKGYGHAWHDCYWMSDDELAAQIAADGIDILVDLAGHTSGNRMLTLARKPAPLQVSWLGYPTITGLAAVDYRVTDPQVDPEDGEPREGTETPLRLPHSYYCYRPIAPAPDVAPPPSVRTGHVTFGSFNNLAKVSDRTLTLWAAVLEAVPASRLLVKARSLDDAAVRRSLQERMQKLGIDAGRLLLRGWEHGFGGQLALYAEIDIALDTFPYNGGTTTCEALWMGVPVVSLRGETHASRMGASLLHAAALPELVARDAESFVRIARELAADGERLAGLRGSMRDRLRAAPLLDEVRFTLDLEAAYGDIWKRWCHAAASTPPPARATIAAGESHRLAAPQDAQTWNSLGLAEQALDHIVQAETCYRRALALDALAVEPLVNLATLFEEQGRFEEAAILLEGGVRQHPTDARVWSNLGVKRLALKEAARAIECFERAMALDPTLASARLYAGIARLLCGDFERGWPLYEARWDAVPALAASRPAGAAREWGGEALDGAPILLYAEQGLGDALQFVRYAPLVAARGGRVHLVTHAALKRLFESVPGVTSVHAFGEPLPACPWQAALMSLPRVMMTTLGSVPNGVPYLSASAADRDREALRLGPRSALRVGFVWAGDPRPDDRRATVVDRRRSVSLAACAALWSVPGIEWYTLQKGAAAAQIRSLPSDVHLIDHTSELDDFLDTAALVSNLDLVISVDTSVAHLAGALGVPVWLLSRSDGCWRWLLDREDSPWYPSLRIFRQEHPFAWGPLIARVADALQAHAARWARSEALV